MLQSTMKSLRILVVDDSPTFLRTLCSFFEGDPNAKVVGTARGAHEALATIADLQPDLVLMDLQMPILNGVETIGRIRKDFPDARIIVLTTYAGDVQVLRALKAGARGYLLKNSMHKELLETIRSVHAGKRALSTEASMQLAEHATDDALTPAEIRVLRLIAEGNANKEVAGQLSVSEETVKGQVRNILSKLGANDRTHAAMIGLKRGIIEI